MNNLSDCLKEYIQIIKELFVALKMHHNQELS
jgi:hypothetical protein